MYKFRMILCLTIFIVSIASSLIAGAQENATECSNNSTTLTNSTTSALVESESNMNDSPIKTQANTGEQAFRVGPTVRLRTLDSEINKSADGIVEVFMNNPNLNEVTLEVDMAVDVPSDIYIYAEDGGMTGGAGTITGHFTVPPGSSRTITLHIKGEKVGTFPVHFSGMYWPGNNKDKWNPINLDSSFDVIEPSSTTAPTPASHMPGFGAGSLVFILVIVFIFRRK